MLICDPDIKAFKLSDEFDFIIMGSDGVFDQASNRELVNNAWGTLKSYYHKNPSSSVQYDG